MVAGFENAELEDAWVEGEEAARWRSAAGLGPSEGTKSSGTSLLEVEPGCLLPRHTDSAEETIVVVAGAARVDLPGGSRRLQPGDATFVPADEPHAVHSVGDGPLRFVAVYAAAEVVTAYEQPIQPDGERERSPV